MRLTFSQDRILAVMAHPDDAELLCAGTLARAKSDSNPTIWQIAQEQSNDFAKAYPGTTEALTANGYAAPCRVYAQGGSAGGLLMAAIANMRPDLYAGIVAEAPFVDVVTTMSDAAVPLTTLEYDEWGNPAVKREFEYMLSYSPYDNVARTDYPAMFITAGFIILGIAYVTRAFSTAHAALLAGIGAGSWSAVVALMMPTVGRLLDAHQPARAFGLAALLPALGFSLWAAQRKWL